MEKKNFYYRTLIKSALGKELRSLYRACERAEAAAERFAAKVGAKEYYPNPLAFVGGVVCVSFPEGTEPDLQLWRSVGKDGDGTEMFEPRCDKRNGSIAYNPHRQPSDTATRIYSKSPAADGRLHYIELYRDDDDSRSKNTKRGKKCNLSLAAKEAIRIERERMLLPHVKTERFFKLLGADLMAGVPENKTVAFIQPETPMIFSFDGYYYIGITYPCAAEGLQPVTQEAFMAKREDLLRMQRDMEAMNDGEHLS